MQKLESALADLLHEQGQGLINQYLSNFKANGCDWYITAFGETRWAVSLAVQKLDKICLEKYGTELTVTGIEVCAEFEEREFCEKYMLSENPSNRITLLFNSPTSFKSLGRYIIFPTKELILQSCINRWNSLACEHRLEDEDAVNHILSHCDIVRYRLKSTLFDFKGVFVPSFIGNLTFSVRGPEPLLRLFNLMTAFSRYCGVGIKTALGMGACVPVFRPSPNNWPAIN
jgi:CRISPR-associated endoribonuclease Cas6